jgi:hypothetical protein
MVFGRIIAYRDLTVYRRGVGAIAMIMALAVILTVTGFAMSYQLSAARRTVEQVQARRWRDLAVASAFDEAAARIAASLPHRPLLAAGQTRDLGSSTNWPKTGRPLTTVGTVDTPVTARDYAGIGISLPEPVTVQSSDWQVDRIPATADGTEKIQEIGILQLSVRVRVRRGESTLKARVVTRRYFLATPSGSGDLEFTVGSTPLCLEVDENV